MQHCIQFGTSNAILTVKSDIPIIAVSANAYEKDKSASLSARMNRHIAKPIDMNELFQTIHLILKERSSTETK